MLNIKYLVSLEAKGKIKERTTHSITVCPASGFSLLHYPFLQFTLSLLSPRSLFFHTKESVSGCYLSGYRGKHPLDNKWELT